MSMIETIPVTVAAGPPSIQVSTNWPNAILGNGSITSMVAMTQAQYDALGTPDPTTYYVIIA